MAHYRKIDTRMALDRKFNALPRDSKLMFYHLLTHRHLTSLGAMHATLPGLARELDFTADEFERAFTALCQHSMVRYDDKTCLLWLPNFLKYNAPESPNAVRAWDSGLSYLPECDLRDALIVHVKAFVHLLPPTFQEALPEVFQVPCLSTEPVAVLPSQIIDKTLKNNPSEGLREDLPEVLGKTFANPSEGLPEDLRQVLSIQEQITRTINKEQEQKEEEIVQEKNCEDKNKIEEIKHIVAQTRQKTSKPPDTEIVDVFRYWQETMGHPQAQLDEKRRKCIRSALSWGYTVAQLREAILGCSLTPHNRGENEQGQRYDGLHIILRSADQIDRFIRNAHSPPRRRTEADRLLADNLAAGERWLALSNHEEKIINAID